MAIEDVDLARTEAKVTESEWKNQLLMAQAAAANARLKQADLAIAKQRLKETKIQVPIPSLDANTDDCEYSVAERLVSEGTMVRPGTELFKLVLGRKLKLRVNLPDVHVPAVEIGQSVQVSSSISSYPFAGTVARISPTIQSASRTFQVEIEVPNEDLRLKPGGFAKAKIFGS